MVTSDRLHDLERHTPHSEEVRAHLRVSGTENRELGGLAGATLFAHRRPDAAMVGTHRHGDHDSPDVVQEAGRVGQVAALPLAGDSRRQARAQEGMGLDALEREPGFAVGILG